jgi:hypothetical protein
MEHFGTSATDHPNRYVTADLLRQKDARIAELEATLELHDAYREVAEAAVLKRDSMLKRDSSFVANRLLYNALQKHSAAIRAAMGERQ